MKKSQGEEGPKVLRERGGEGSVVFGPDVGGPLAGVGEGASVCAAAAAARAVCTACTPCSRNARMCLWTLKINVFAHISNIQIVMFL